MRESPNLTRKRSIPSNNTSDEIQFFGSGKSGTVLPKVSFPSQPEKNKICGDCLITNANLEVRLERSQPQQGYVASCCYSNS